MISAYAFQNQDFLAKTLFIPYRVKHNNEYIRMFSHMFIHADWAHLIFNMFSLYFLGQILAFSFTNSFGQEGGMIHFAILYFFGGIFASLFPYIRNHENPNYTSLGASGAVSAVVFAAILWNPTMKLALLFLPIPIPAYIFGPLYLAFEYFALRKGKGNIAHDAHIGGALFGILYVLLIDPSKGSEFIQLIMS
jgi:membrane associated rhomboid family serine protease